MTTSQDGRTSRTFRRATQGGFIVVASPPPRRRGKDKEVWANFMAFISGRPIEPKGKVDAQIKSPELMPPNGRPLVVSGRLSTMAGAKVPANPSRGGRTGARDERRLAGRLPNHSCVMMVGERRNK